MVDYEKTAGPIVEEEPKDSGQVCPGCGKQNLVVKRTINIQGRTAQQALLCTLCNYQDSRLIDKVSGEVMVDRKKEDGRLKKGSRL